MFDEAPFGAWLKEYRRAHDLTRIELARQIGCSPETIHKIEDGVRRPSKQIAALLADYVRVPPDQRAAFIEFARTTGQPARRDPAGAPPPPVAAPLAPPTN